MSAHREPNPLRPYYNPPPISEPFAGASASLGQNVSSKPISAPSQSFGTSARNILADMDYSDYVSDSSAGASDAVKAFIEQMAWKYSSVFLAQPFEVSRTLLQVQVLTIRDKKSGKDPYVEEWRRQQASYRDSDDSSDSDPDFPSYFTSSAPSQHTPSQPSRGRRRRTSPSPDGIPRVHPPRSPPRKPPSPHQLDLHSSSSILSAISSLWTSEGAWGIWKGCNSTFVYTILLHTVTSFARSFLSAVFALPDPGLTFVSTTSTASAGGLDVLNSDSPISSLVVAVSAAGIAGTLLAPLDMARTKLMVTPSTHPPRSIIATLRTLPSWTLPSYIAPTTILHSTLPTFISTSVPLLLRSRLGIDPVLTPSLYSVATFCSQAVELVVKIPLETILRRGQIAVALSASDRKPFDTIVEIGAYKGLFGTMRHIMYEEGEKAASLPKGGQGRPDATITKLGQNRKGQGVEGLYRGWRVGMWGLLGVWGAATLGTAKGGEF